MKKIKSFIEEYFYIFSIWGIAHGAKLLFKLDSYQKCGSFILILCSLYAFLSLYRLLMK